MNSTREKICLDNHNCTSCLTYLGSLTMNRQLTNAAHSRQAAPHDDSKQKEYCIIVQLCVNGIAVLL